MKFYTVAQIAEIFHISCDTARVWISGGKFGEVVNTGKIKLVTQAGLEKYISEHTGPAYNPRAFSVRGKSSYPHIIAKL